MKKLMLKLSYVKTGRIIIHIIALLIFKETVINCMCGIIREFKI